MLSAYAILGIDAATTDADLRRAYRRKVFAHSPDRVDQNDGAAVAAAIEEMKRINWAWSMLEDATKRALYDQKPRSYGEAEDAEEGRDDADTLRPPSADEIGQWAARVTGDREVGDVVAEGVEFVARGVRFLSRLGTLAQTDD